MMIRAMVVACAAIALVAIAAAVISGGGSLSVVPLMEWDIPTLATMALFAAGLIAAWMWAGANNRTRTQ